MKVHSVFWINNLTGNAWLHWHHLQFVHFNTTGVNLTIKYIQIHLHALHSLHYMAIDRILSCYSLLITLLIPLQPGCELHNAHQEGWGCIKIDIYLITCIFFSVVVVNVEYISSSLLTALKRGNFITQLNTACILNTFCFCSVHAINARPWMSCVL